MPDMPATPAASIAPDAPSAPAGRTAHSARSVHATPVIDRMRRTLVEHQLAAPDAAVLLMVSGGSDSTALAYLAAELRDAGELGPLAMLHVNHQLRGADADGDAQFVATLAEALGIPLFACEVDVAGEAQRTGGNVEAVARSERYLAANEALRSMAFHEGCPLSEARIFTAHTADDRIESFYMRSIVGTGPGGFRSMLYRNGPVARPLLDATRDELRTYIKARAAAADAAPTPDAPCVRDSQGALWREDATNAHTDRFRAYVRHEVVSQAKAWNPRMPENLVRTMNLIAEEDDMLDAMAAQAIDAHAVPVGQAVQGAEGSAARGASGEGAAEGPSGYANGREGAAAEAPAAGPAAPGAAPATPLDDAAYAEGFLLKPSFDTVPTPLQRRAAHRLLKAMLGAEERIDAASVEAVLAGFGATGAPVGGYVANIQGNLAVSANKKGVRVEPMAAFRARRKRAETR